MQSIDLLRPMVHLYILAIVTSCSHISLWLAILPPKCCGNQFRQTDPELCQQWNRFLISQSTSWPSLSQILKSVKALQSKTPHADDINNQLKGGKCSGTDQQHEPQGISPKNLLLTSCQQTFGIKMLQIFSSPC